MVDQMRRALELFATLGRVIDHPVKHGGHYCIFISNEFGDAFRDRNRFDPSRL